jgi:ribonuclease HI
MDTSGRGSNQGANVDAAVSRDKSTGSVAVVLRRGDREYMGSSAVVFKGVSDRPTLEALACREALALATDVALNCLIIASDCRQVVLDIAAGTGGQYAAILQEINIQRLDFRMCLILLRVEIQIRRLIV